jgi:hypothetical protein
LEFACVELSLREVDVLEVAFEALDKYGILQDFVPIDLDPKVLIHDAFRE